MALSSLESAWICTYVYVCTLDYISLLVEDNVWLFLCRRFMWSQTPLTSNRNVELCPQHFKQGGQQEVAVIAAWWIICFCRMNLGFYYCTMSQEWSQILKLVSRQSLSTVKLFLMTCELQCHPYLWFEYLLCEASTPTEHMP